MKEQLTETICLCLAVEIGQSKHESMLKSIDAFGRVASRAAICPCEH